MSFKTQQEIWHHLAQGGAVQHVKYRRCVIRFIDGRIDAGDSSSSGWSFSDPGVWQPYIEPLRKVKKTFYRRKWCFYNGTLHTNVGWRASKEQFDSQYRNDLIYAGAVWSDEWETIETEVTEETK